jgi:iron complex outermembrane receptor protein
MRARIRAWQGEWVFACALTVLAISPPMTARGQERTSAAAAETTSAPADNNALAEVIVEAQYRKQDLQDTPISITALSAESLAARGAQSVLDIASQAPNVTLERGVASNGPTLQAFIRGVGQTDFNYAFEPGVGMYVDDVYYSTITGSVLDLLDLSRVEVLRGPQGTLEGMNSMGGAIKLYSKLPNGQDDGYLEGTYGSFNRADFRGGANFTVIPDQLFMRIAGVERHQDGYVKDYDYACSHAQLAATYTIPTSLTNSGCEIGTEGGTNYQGVRLTVRWVPTDRLEGVFAGDYTSDRSDPVPQTLLYVGSMATPGLPAALQGKYPMNTSAPVNGLPLANSAGVSPYITYSPFGPYAGDPGSRSPYVTYGTFTDVKPPDGTAAYSDPRDTSLDSYGASATFHYKISDDFNLTSISAYRRYSAYWASDYDATQLSNALLSYDVWHWQFSQELRLAGQLAQGKVDWVLGGFYFDERSHYGGRVDQGSQEFVESDIIPGSNKAAFANAGWHITDQLEFNAGLRYTQENKDFDYGRFGVPNTPVAPPYLPCPQLNGAVVFIPVCALNGVVGRFSDHNVDYRAVLQYTWIPGLMTYASVSTGFKGGGVNPRPFYPSQAEPFKPEKLVNYEVGLKSSWWDQRVTANLSLFDSRYEAIQLAVSSGCDLAPGQTLCSLYLNTGDGHQRGVELELHARPTARLSIDASASYLHFSYSSITPQAAAAGVHQGMATPYSPSAKADAGIQYTLDVGSLATLTPRFDVSHQASLYQSAANNWTNLLPGYTLLNGHLTWAPRDGKWQAVLEGTNLTNKLYYTGTSFTVNAYTLVGSPAAPREWALTLKRYF